MREWESENDSFPLVRTLKEWEGQWEFERILRGHAQKKVLDVVARRTVCLREFWVLFFEF